MFEEIIEDTMQELKEKLENNKLSNNKCNNFLIDYEWEDEFSHNEIGEMQQEFIKRASTYLENKCKNRYIIYCDWCVHICSIDFYNNIVNKR